VAVFAVCGCVSPAGETAGCKLKFQPDHSIKANDVQIAIHNPFAGNHVAETELSCRMSNAFAALGHAAREVSTLDGIEACAPDFVLALHPLAAKISGFPTYGCMWSPSSYLRSERLQQKNIKTYDGYFCGSAAVHQWIADLLKFHPKSADLGLLLPSVGWSEFAPSAALQAGQATVAYFGSNWDGERHREIFEEIDGCGLVTVHGRKGAWDFLRHSYGGVVAFDGVSVVNAIARCGVGLCLHAPGHLAGGIPNMRIFETVAAGAVAIADRHPFIERHFGGCVLYLGNGNAASRAQELIRHLAWVRHNPVESVKMAAEAHAVLRQFSLESMLDRVVKAHDARMRERRYAVIAGAGREPEQIQVIVRTGNRAPQFLRRALASLAAQDYPDISAIIVAHGNRPGVKAVAAEFPRLQARLIDSQNTGYRSTQLFEGLRAVNSKYFAILDDDDIVYSNHYGDLIALLRKNRRFGLAYSGSNRIIENLQQQVRAVNLGMFHDFDKYGLYAFENFIASNSFVARSELLSRFPLTDPSLVAVEDFYLVLKLLKFTRFAFSWNVSCAYCWREEARDNVTSLEVRSPELPAWGTNADPTWPEARARVRALLGITSRPLWRRMLIKALRRLVEQTSISR
jgi:hypothetical protein